LIREASASFFNTAPQFLAGPLKNGSGSKLFLGFFDSTPAGNAHIRAVALI